MKRTSTVELTAEELKEAIAYWLKLTKNLVSKEVYFDIKAEMSLGGFYVAGATVKLDDDARLERGGPDDR